LSSYFRLEHDCFLVEGVSDAALYDVTGRRLYLLDDEARQIVRQCESNSALDRDWLNDNGRRFLEFLRDEGLGFFDQSPAFIDKFVTHGPVATMNSRSSKVPRYFMADWSITQSCDVGCLFCPLESGAWSWQACTACLRKADVDEDANVFRHTSIIVNQLASLGVKRLYIRGGNPLLAWDRLVSILDEAERYPEIIVTITTPAAGVQSRTCSP